ncbi:MAG TPA: DEAD/DEAH box helicase [Flavobacteriaceae bacterium]|nr:DEAD/DEAH box helicase [Flavobacteriaceae bacterium]
MTKTNKNQEAILNKLGIEHLNQMQEDAYKAILSKSEIVLLSPTGTGKTLAFLLPILTELDINSNKIQVLIVVPSRELAIQIEQVVRDMGSGFKTNAVYGGRAGSKDKIELKHPPAILIGTPGRIADHIRRQIINIDGIKTLVLDEFDKSLEIGFENEMKEILEALSSTKKKILTSATQKVAIPSFLRLKNPHRLNYLSKEINQLKQKTIIADSKDKLATLEALLGHIGIGNGFIFCNLKDTIEDVSDFLYKKNISHGCFYGGLEQMDRERALIKFRNGTHRLLLATDLAARGIDVPEMDFIIHYELSIKKDEFIHRNGRTARMNSNGTAYIMKWKNELLPEFMEGSEIEEIKSSAPISHSKWETLYISGGRKDKISKGDIAGLFFKQGELLKEELGSIELKHDCAYVAVPKSKSKKLSEQLNNSVLKKKKVRISILN